MNTRAEYDRALAVVRDVIREWDPYALLAGGASADEWDGEIASVVAQIPRIRSPNDAANALSRVFSSAFQSEGFRPADCADAGKRLYASLEDSGLLETRG